jgi:hypothetical protein
MELEAMPLVTTAPLLVHEAAAPLVSLADGTPQRRRYVPRSRLENCTG